MIFFVLRSAMSAPDAGSRSAVATPWALRSA